MRREFLLWATKNSSKCFQQYATRKMTSCFIVASIAADCCNFKFHDWISLSSGVCVRVFVCVLRAATLKPGMNLYTGHCRLYQAIILNLVVSQTVREKQKDIGVICKTNRDATEMSLRLINTFAHLRRCQSTRKKCVCFLRNKINTAWLFPARHLDLINPANSSDTSISRLGDLQRRTFLSWC